MTHNQDPSIHDVTEMTVDGIAWPNHPPVGVLCWARLDGCEVPGCTCLCHPRWSYRLPPLQSFMGWLSETAFSMGR